MNVVLVGADGTRSFLTNPNGTLRSLRIDDIEMPFPESAKIICFASIFVFPKIGPDELTRIFKKAKSQGKIVCADMTKRKKNETLQDMAEAFSYIDYLLPNDEEAMLLTGADSVEECIIGRKKCRRMCKRRKSVRCKIGSVCWCNRVVENGN